MRARNDLTEGPVVRKLLGMAVPMLGGTFAMTTFNLADTYFVSRLGTLPVAAMGFTFPVVMFVACINVLRIVVLLVPLSYLGARW